MVNHVRIFFLYNEVYLKTGSIRFSHRVEVEVEKNTVLTKTYHHCEPVRHPSTKGRTLLRVSKSESCASTRRLAGLN